MSIAFLIGSLSNSGGTQRMLTLLCNELVHDHSITVFTHKAGDAFFSLDKRVAVQVLKGNLWQKNRRMYKILKQNKTRYYINLDSNSVLLNGFLLPKCTKLIIWEHFSLENNYKKLLFYLSRVYAGLRAYKFVVLSQKEKDLWVKKYKVKAGKLEVVYNPITVDKKDIDATPRYHAKQALAIGNNSHVKGFDILINSWKGVPKDWHLTVVGLPAEDQKTLNRYKAKHNIENVTLYGRVAEITEFYKKASLFILSSRKEATPLVLLESQAFGLPGIAFDHLSGVKEIAKDSVFYADYQQKEKALMDKLNQLMSSKKLFEFYHRKALSNVKNYTREEFTDKWRQIFNA